MNKIFLPESYGKFVEVSVPNNALMIGIRQSLGEEICRASNLPSLYAKEAMDEIIRVALSEAESLPEKLPPNIFGIFYTPNNIGNTHVVDRLCGSDKFTAYETWGEDGTVHIIVKEGTGFLVPIKLSYEM